MNDVHGHTVIRVLRIVNTKIRIMRIFVGTHNLEV